MTDAPYPYPPKASIISGPANFPIAVGLAVAVGAGCTALAHFVVAGPFTAAVFTALLVHLGLAWGTSCGHPRLEQACRGLRMTLLVLVPLMVAASFGNLLPDDTKSDPTAITAVLMGWLSVFSVLLVGLGLHGQSFGWATPLVPTLSLFGLLNVLSVDTIVEGCFLTFVAAALFVLAYQGALGTAANLWLTVRHYVLACGVWFGAFVVGGLILYYPLLSFLARYVTSPMINGQRASQAMLMDFRGASPLLELGGGQYSLSEKEMLRISSSGGEPRHWRGRVYERYLGSRWAEISLPQNRRSPVPSPEGFTSLPRRLPRVPPSIGAYREIVDEVEPLGMLAPKLFSAGEPVAIKGDWKNPQLLRNGTVSILDFWHAARPYAVRSKVLEVPDSQLARLRGLTATEVANWRSNRQSPATLDLPAQPAAGGLLQVRQKIIDAARRRGKALRTPYDHVQAIRRYLIETCTYSLDSPPVPRRQDAVLFFLNGSHSGACDMFASSATLLLRTFHVPARLATGYLRPNEATTGDGRAETVTLRERDAHAWVEYYLPQVGWLSFDPTADTRQAQRVSTGQLIMRRLQQVLANARLLLLPALGLALLAAGGIWWLRERQRPGMAAGAEDELRRRQAAAVYARALVLLRPRVAPPPRCTAVEYEALVRQSDVPAPAQSEFSRLTQVFVASQYGSSRATDHIGELQAALRELRRVLRTG